MEFPGPGGGESTGIVDFMAIRKDHSQPETDPLKRGDLFEIILIQVKGGSARMPTRQDVLREPYNASEGYPRGGKSHRGQLRSLVRP